MTMVLGPVFWVIGAVFGLVVASAVGLAPYYQLALGIAGAALFGLVHWYSPIPNHNGGFGMGTPRIQKWGFTSEPRNSDGGEER